MNKDNVTDIKAENEIKKAWEKKLTSLRLQEPMIIDHGQLFALQQDIKKAEEKIEMSNLRISELKKEKEEEFANDNSEENDKHDILKALEILRQESKELNSRTTKEEIANLHDLRIKISEQLNKELDDKLNLITSKRELLYSSVLFDKIYSSPTLDSITIQEILKIRGNNEDYFWFDRSVIVSALSLSLINFKFDSKKANLLLDFITDFEDMVWERALTGLTISIIYQKNRSWCRDINFINRIKTLQNNDKIQDGLKLIDFILKNKLYETNLFSPNLFKIKLFENPMNSFVPFYENNEILRNALDEADNGFEIEEFKKYLDETPIMDSHKYALCIGLSSGGLEKEVLEGERAFKINKSLLISENLKPFQNLISEYYCFFYFFPKKLKNDVFEKQLLITNTDLRKFILNRVNQILLEADTLFNQEKYSEAISKYTDLLKIDNNHFEANFRLADCYLEKKEYKKAQKQYLNLNKDLINENNLDLIYKIAVSYNLDEQYEISNNYIEIIEKKIPKISFNTSILKAENYYEINDFKKSLIYIKRAHKSANNDQQLYEVSNALNNVEEYEDAIKILEKIKLRKPEKAKYYKELGLSYTEILNWDLAIENFILAKSYDNKDHLIKMSLARVYLFSKSNLSEAKNIFEKIVSSKFDFKGIVYGNIGHLYFIENDELKAIENYKKSITEIKDEKDFNKKMNHDLKFIKNLNLDEKKYIKIKDDIIKNYIESKK